MQTIDSNIKSRVIGLDSHPDSFTAVIVSGQTPAEAVCLKTFNKLSLSTLVSWAKKNTLPQDKIVLEASGNSFQIVRTLAKVDRTAIVLESCHLGKLKEAHANNDKISAMRIAKGYLAGTAKEVWVPDPLTQQRRDLFHAHRKAVKRTTQMRNRLRSYLSDNGVRLRSEVSLDPSPELTEEIRQSASWSPLQWNLIEGYLMELQHSETQRAHLRQMIAQEVLQDERVLALTRLCGIRDLVAFALTAFIGDVKRFASPKALVKYVGLTPAFDDSGEGQWQGGIRGHGRKDLRCLVIESAQAILRSNHPIANWGRKLLRKKGHPNIAVAAVARKLVVAVWYYLNGKAQPLTEVDAKLGLKVNKIIANVGANRIKELGKTRKELKEETYEKLKSTKIYILKPMRKMVPKAKPRIMATS